MKKKITEVLRGLAVSPSNLGYEYLKTAIELCIVDKTAVHKITKVLYPRVALVHQTTSSRVERAIRRSIEISIVKLSKEELSKYFYVSSNGIMDKPTNSEYIASIVDILRIDMEQTNEVKENENE